jgi:hypothetical protein
MRKVIVPLVVGAVCCAAVTAHAQCAFDGPSKAKGFKTSLVRAFAPCPSVTFPIPNSQTGTGVGTCAPPFPYSDPRAFARKNSGCTVSTSAKLESPCSMPAGDCMNVSIKAKCTGLTLEGVTPSDADDQGYKLNIVTRATIDDRTFGDMTSINFPVSIPFSIPVRGKMSLETNTNTLLDDLGLETLPPCSEVEIVSLSVQDPDGNIYAKLGAGTHPLDAEP